MSELGWIGFDLDGTLAYYESGDFQRLGPTHIGAPIMPIVRKLLAYHAEGLEVKIMTARADSPSQVVAIKAWSLKHLGFTPDVTNKKDYRMILLYDDRAVAVEPNTGQTKAWR